MRADPGLAQAVAAFRRDVGAAVAAAGAPGDDVERRVAGEAFLLTAGFVESDGILTDAELWSLLELFGDTVRGFGEDIGTTPDEARAGGSLDGISLHLTTSTDIQRLLQEADERGGTAHLATYHDRAVAIGFAVAAIDAYTTEAEVRAIETFRAALHARGGPTPAAATPGPEAPATPAPPPLEPARPLAELIAELDDLVGLDAVKAEVKLVTNLIQVQNLRRERGLPVVDQSRHLVFTGNPGTGKTTVARLLAQIYRTLGVVERGHLVETDRSGLVAGFVGQTATRVVETFDRADQGVLLVDEAYSLVRGGEKDFGREAIDTMVKLIEDRRDRVVVIVTGYPDEMAALIDANPGLKSRFPKTIVFDDYGTDELMAIFAKVGEDHGYRSDDGALAAVRAWFDAQDRGKGFGNGRVARNLFEAAVARHATRIVTVVGPTDAQLSTLEAADVPPLADGTPAVAPPPPPPPA